MVKVTVVYKASRCDVLRMLLDIPGPYSHVGKGYLQAVRVTLCETIGTGVFPTKTFIDLVPITEPFVELFLCSNVVNWCA